MLTRLAALGPARLARPGPDGGASAVQLVRPLLQRLADVAARAEGRATRPVPQLAPHALGDQLAVLARDVLAVQPPLADASAELPVDPWVDPWADVLEDVAARLTALRRALP